MVITVFAYLMDFAMPEINVSDRNLDRMKKYVRPFVDKEPDDVIGQLLDFREAHEDERTPPPSASPTP
jgi:hypothetical protein